MARKTKSTKKKSMKKMRGGEGCSLKMGGKRRRGSRGSRRMRGGMYGFGGNAIAPGTLEASAAYTGAADPKTGAAVPDPALKGTPSEGSFTGLGGRRRSRKGSKKSRKGTRKMKGGYTPGMMSAAPVGYGFTDGSLKTSGPPNVTQYTQPGNRI